MTNVAGIDADSDVDSDADSDVDADSDADSDVLIPDKKTPCDAGYYLLDMSVFICFY